MNLDEFSDDDIVIHDEGRCVDCGDSFGDGERIFQTVDGFVCGTCFARRDS